MAGAAQVPKTPIGEHDLVVKVDRIARRLGYASTPAAPASRAFLDELEYHRATVRRIYEKIVKREEG